MRIVSMSKAIGATAAAIAVERGLFRWDTPVDEILPEFGKLSVLVDRVDGTPYFRAPRTRATLGHLATHTSGLTYEFWNEDIAHHLEEMETPSAVTGRKEALTYPWHLTQVTDGTMEMDQTGSAWLFKR
jgi:CubicO group peptidase (beta-lactamase class C family)